MAQYRCEIAIIVTQLAIDYDDFGCDKANLDIFWFKGSLKDSATLPNLSVTGLKIIFDPEAAL